MSIKFGLIVPQGWRMDLVDFADPVEKYEAMTRTAQEAERLGFDSVWLYDHFHTVPKPTQEATFECWTTTAALARDTKTVRVGQIVTCNGYRNPAYLAKVASTVDVLSHGRLFFGLGAGWYEHEYKAYHYEYHDAPTRLKMMGEALQVIRAMWTEDYATFNGKFYQVNGAINQPKGVQRPHPPILVGGGGEKVTLKLVAKYADACNIGGTNPDVYQHKFAVLRQHCQDVGRDYNTVLRTSEINVFLSDNSANLEAETAGFRQHTGNPNVEDLRKNQALGTAQEVITTFNRLVEAGVQYFIVYLYNAAHLEQIQRFARDVMPAFS